MDDRYDRTTDEGRWAMEERRKIDMLFRPSSQRRRVYK
jgi:hypothetical protein